MNPLAISGISIMVTCFLLTLLILMRSERKPLHQLWAAFNIAVGLWGLGTCGVGLSRTAETGLVWWKVAHIGGIFLGVIFFHLVSLFLRLQRRAVIIGVYTYAVLFSALAIAGIAVSSPRLLFGSLYYTTTNPLHAGLIATWVGIVAATHYDLIKELRSGKGYARQQIKYLLIGMAVGFTGGTSVLLPMFHVPVYPWGNFSIPFYCVIVTYAILKHHLMDIEVVIKRTLQFAGLVGSVVAVVSVVAFVSQDVLARFVEIPRWLSNVFAAGIIAALYGPVRDWLTNVTDRYLFQKKYDYKQLLRAFTDEVVTVLDLRRLVEMIVERLATTLKLETCALFLLNRERQRYDLAASRGLGDATLNIREDEDIVALLRQTQEPVSRDSHEEMPERVTKRFEELKASLCFPLVLHDDLMGVLCLGKKKSDEEFTKDDIDILLSLTKTLAIAVSNAQLVAEAAQKEKLAVIGTLAAAINHEVCNPLNNVKVQSEGFLINLKRGIFDPLSREDLVQKFAELLQRTMAEVDRSAAITTRLSNFAKPVREPISESVDIRQVINDVTALLGHDFELNMIRIQQEIPASLPPIRADRKQIGEIFFNLMRNAAQAIQQHGMITIRARPNPNSRVLVEIQDTGCGMSPEHLGKLFTPFFTTKNEGHGTGLGLFVVQRLVERNGGTISVSSARGVGTTFTLEFSIHESALVQSADR